MDNVSQAKSTADSFRIMYWSCTNTQEKFQIKRSSISMARPTVHTNPSKTELFESAL